MSQATKRKHVVKEVLGDFVTPTETQQIVKITGSRGNNLHETVTAKGETFLVSMPTKFRKNLWIKRGPIEIKDLIFMGDLAKTAEGAEYLKALFPTSVGAFGTESIKKSTERNEYCRALFCDYVIVDPIDEGEKVKAEISFILYKDHIQYLQGEQLWPEGFTEELSEQDRTNKQPGEDTVQEEDVSDSEDDESDLFVNTNRCNYQYSESEEEEEESEEEEDDKKERTENVS